MELDKLANEEQPEITSHSVATHDDKGDIADAGSSFGKFKDANELLKAYNNLQSEFTRKCQLLNELKAEDSADKVELSPQYESDDWQKQIGEFLECHPEAKKYSRQIADELYSDKTLASNPSSLELAYSRIIAKEYKSNDELVKDEAFLNDYIFNNPEITNKVLNNYFKNYSKSPQLISSKVGASVNLTPEPKANNLTEARKLVEQLFKN